MKSAMGIRGILRGRGLVGVLLTSICLVTFPSFGEPFHTYLTWQNDTSTTMTVNFHTRKGSKSFVRYDTVSHSGDPEGYALEAQGASHKISGLADKRSIHVVELTGLEPGETYYFIAGDKKKGFTEEKKFRTIPSGDAPIRFVTGGDMNIGRITERLQALAGEQDPMFTIVGGDLAYVNGELAGYKKWDRWLRNWEKYMVTPGGYLIPMVLAIGNHEVKGAYSQPTGNAPFYFGYFAQTRLRSYFTRKFGDNFVFFILDTGHIASHGGDQKTWLEEALQDAEATKFKFAIYHIPLYPSFRPFEGKPSELGREHWAPLFDKYGLTTAFENHDHTHKRTKRITANEVNTEGVLYLGDGSFGVGPRDVAETLRWYEVTASSTSHIWLVDVTSSKVVYRAINEEGEVFDSTESE